MQKIFTKNISIVIVIALAVLFGLSWILLDYNARQSMYENASLKLEQLSHTLESNERELNNLKESLGEDYLTRARAFAYLIGQNPSVLSSQEELQRIKVLLNVDELHVIDENGILFAGTVPQYFGMDFASTEQTAEFLQILEKSDSYLVQDVQPNGAEQKMFQYVGVARTDRKGIVQVGLAPVRLMEAQKRNELPYIISMLPVDAGTVFYIVDRESGTIRAHSNAAYIGKTVEELGVDKIDLMIDGGFRSLLGERKYYVTREYGGLVLGIGVTKESLHKDRNGQMALIFLLLLLISSVMILTLNKMLKIKVVDGMHQIVNDLSDITKGRLDRVVSVESAPEFRQLSGGINQMVKSILEANVMTSRVIDVVDMPIGVFEYDKNSEKVTATGRLRQVMMWTEEEAERLYRGSTAFAARLNALMEHSGKEEGIYQLCGSPEKWVRIQMTVENDRTFGIVADVTDEVAQRRRIEHERDTDSLTGLRNFDTFGGTVRELLKTEETLGTAAMVMLDLDHFKNINDRFGHDWGDEYLRACASFLKELETGRAVAARRSGDEFCLFFYRYGGKEEIRRVMETFYGRLEERKITFPDGSVRSLSISAGLAWYEEERKDYGLLLKASDVTLYRAKNSGRGKWSEYREEEG